MHIYITPEQQQLTYQMWLILLKLDLCGGPKCSPQQILELQAAAKPRRGILYTHYEITYP